jgi:hypothetical protein
MGVPGVLELKWEHPETLNQVHGLFWYERATAETDRFDAFEYKKQASYQLHCTLAN